MNASRPIPQRVLDRVWSRIDVRGPDECWPCVLSIGSHGYAQIGWWQDGRSVMTTAHRVAWASVFGPIPDGMTIDHKCRNRPCCNVRRHLRLLTNIENATDNGWAAGTRRRVVT